MFIKSKSLLIRYRQAFEKFLANTKKQDQFILTKLVTTHLALSINGFIYFMLILFNWIAGEWVNQYIYKYLLVRYSILIWVMGWFYYLSYYFGKISNKILTRVIVILIFLAVFSMTWLVLVLNLSQNAEIGLAIIAAAYCFFPTYNFTLALLEVIGHMLIRIFILSIFISIVGGYTLFIFGTYDIFSSTPNADYSQAGITEYTGQAINRGLTQLSYKAIENLEYSQSYKFIQVYIGLLGGLIITHVTKVTLDGKK